MDKKAGVRIASIAIFVCVLLLTACGGQIEQTMEQVAPTLEVVATAMADAAVTAEETPMPAEETAVPTVPATAPPESTPAQVTDSFYAWYLDSIRAGAPEEITNPLVEGLYRERPELSPEFVTAIDETLAGFEQGGFDPLLLAQDIPERIVVGSASVAGDEATVEVLRYWGGNPDPNAMIVHLQRADGRWQITAVTSPHVAANVAQSPAAVVQDFYDWYLAYIGTPGEDDFRNPLVDRAYRDAPYLSPEFVQQVDALLDQFRQQFGGVGYDPILCAQDIPRYLTPDVTLTSNGRARVATRSSFPNQMITVTLQQAGESWTIRDITCAMDPVGVATAFYTWYLGYIGGAGSPEMRNPLVDQAYHDNPLLAESLVAQVDETIAGFSGGGYDPFLLAQDVPDDFSVEAGPEEGTAVVQLQFGPQSTRDLLLTMDETGRRIAAIAEYGDPSSAVLPVDDATTFSSVEHGFSFSYPAGWVLQEMAHGGPGMPEDWPVQAGWLLMPPDVATALAQTALPDPNAPVIVAPINIEVLAGDEAALERVYGPLDGQTAVLGGHEALVLQRDPGYSYTIFAHPQRAATWLILTDWVTGFPGREEQAQAAVPAKALLLESLAFAE